MHFASLGAFIFQLGAVLSGWLGYHELGAALPAATANFETSLASPITSSATSMTLTANSVRGGGSLAGFNCFVVDEGSAQSETICGTVSSTAVSSLTRGVSQATGTSTVAALQFAHRRGANVKISDFPVIQILKAQLNGEDTIPNPIKYASIATTTIDNDRNNLATWGLVQDTAFNAVGALAASETTSGYVELATGAEAAASNSTGGTGARTALPASIATSTYNSATAANVIPVTGGGGTIDASFLPTTITSPRTFSATTTFGSDINLTNHIWGGQGYSRLLTASATAETIGAASTTIYTATIPGNVIATSSMVRVTIEDFSIRCAGNGFSMEAAYGNSTTTMVKTLTPSATTTITFILQGAGATNSQTTRLTVSGPLADDFTATTSVKAVVSGTAATNSNSAQTLRIVARDFSGGCTKLSTGGFSYTELLGL